MLARRDDIGNDGKGRPLLPESPKSSTPPSHRTCSRSLDTSAVTSQLFKFADQFIQPPVDNLLYRPVFIFTFDPMIGHSALWKIICPDPFAAIATANLPQTL